MAAATARFGIVFLPESLAGLGLTLGVIRLSLAAIERDARAAGRALSDPKEVAGAL